MTKRISMAVLLSIYGLALGQEPRMIVRGSHESFDLFPTIGRVLELLIDRETFERNWPFYGYNSSTVDHWCKSSNPIDPDFSVGEVGVVFPSTNAESRGTQPFDYVGLALPGTASTAGRPMEHNASELCDSVFGPANEFREVWRTIHVPPIIYSGGAWESVARSPVRLVPFMIGSPIADDEDVRVVWTRCSDDTKCGLSDDSENSEESWWKYTFPSTARTTAKRVQKDPTT